MQKGVLGKVILRGFGFGHQGILEFLQFTDCFIENHFTCCRIKSKCYIDPNVAKISGPKTLRFLCVPDFMRR